MEYALILVTAEINLKMKYPLNSWPYSDSHCEIPVVTLNFLIIMFLLFVLCFLLICATSSVKVIFFFMRSHSAEL